MKILIVSAWCPFPADNGSRLRAYNLIKQLARRGNRISLVALGQDDSDFAAAKEGLAPFCEGGIALFPSRFFRPGTIKALLGYFSPKPRMLMDTWCADAAAEIGRQCGTGAFDVTLAMQLGAAHYIPENLPVPCVLDEVEVSSLLSANPNYSWSRRLRHSLMAAKFRAHVAALAPRYAVWTTVSDAECEAISALAGFSGPPITVLPNGVDLIRNSFDSAAHYESNQLIYNGALSFYANREAVEYFLGDILPIIKAERPHAHLVVTGRADSLASNDPLRQNDSLRLTGYLDDMRPAVRGAAVCVVPLRQGGGTRLKILEAMALGTPVVATSLGASGLGARDGDEILIADRPTDFAQAVMLLMTDAAARKRITRNARAFVEAHYGWDEIGEKLSDLLAEVSASAPVAQGAACH